jgi:hypothetical protein
VFGAAAPHDCEIARELSTPRATVQDWRRGRTPDFDRVCTRGFPNGWVCEVCRGDPMTLPQIPYMYLLGPYLGDGYIASHARGVYRLRIYCANAYPGLIERCEQAMGTIIATKVSRVRCVGCTEVASFSKHWPCLLPQHGPGRKHERRIELTLWQRELVDLDPRPHPGAAALGRVQGAELGERDPVFPVPLLQRVGGHPGDLRAGL